MPTQQTPSEIPVEHLYNHYCRMLLTRHYDQRPFDETVCDALIANDDVKNHKKTQIFCDEWYIKNGSDFSCCAMLGIRLIHSNGLL